MRLADSDPSCYFFFLYWKYQVGFDMIDAFARSEGIPMTTVHCKALFGEGSLSNLPNLDDLFF